MDPMKHSRELFKGMTTVVAATLIGATTAVAMDSVNRQVGTVMMNLTQADHSPRSPKVCYRNSILKRPLCH